MCIISYCVRVSEKVRNAVPRIVPLLGNYGCSMHREIIVRDLDSDTTDNVTIAAWCTPCPCVLHNMPFPCRHGARVVLSQLRDFRSNGPSGVWSTM